MLRKYALACSENIDYGEADGSPEDPDLALARRLQAEEMQQQYTRLLDMAGDDSAASHSSSAFACVMGCCGLCKQTQGSPRVDAARKQS